MPQRNRLSSAQRATLLGIRTERVGRAQAAAYGEVLAYFISPFVKRPHLRRSTVFFRAGCARLPTWRGSGVRVVLAEGGLAELRRPAATIHAARQRCYRGH